MYQGFYNLTSGMITQQRALNTISNNMVNAQTAGYKSDTLVSRTFQEEMLVRTGRRNKGNATPLSATSKIRRAEQTYTTFEQGTFDPTDGKYDVAISGPGWFAIQTQGGVQYTRNGSFTVRDDGTLEISGIGTVMGIDNQPIRIPNEDFNIDSYGNIISTRPNENAGDPLTGQNGNLDQPVSYGTIRIVGFQDEGTLHKEDNGMYTSPAEAGATVNGTGETKLLHGMLERSNTNLVQEMTTMISSQRAYQSAAQMLRMYDSVMSKSSTDVGRL